MITDSFINNHPLNEKNNGIALIYNQFPRCYNNGFMDMTLQLKDINNMGFNIVWINPFQEAGREIIVQRVNEINRNKLDFLKKISLILN